MKASVIDVDRVINVIHRRCNSQGVTLEWKPGAATAYTNGKNIVIPAVSQPISQEQLETLYGFIVHECGHHSRPEAFSILNSAQPCEALAAMMNIIEDDGMERAVSKDYLGDRKALGVSNNITLNQAGTHFKTMQDKADPEATEAQMAPLAVTALGQLSRVEWDSYSNEGRADFFNYMHPVAKKLTDTLVKEGWVDKMRNTKTPHDTWDVAVDLFKRLYPNEDEQKAEETRAKGHEMAEPTPGEQGSEEQQGTGSKGNGDEAEAGAPAEQGTIISWKDAVLSEHNEWQPKDLDSVAGTVGIDWSGYNEGGVSLMPQDMVNVVDLNSKEVKGRNCNYNHLQFMADNSSARSFGNQVRRYIQARDRTEVDRERRHGKLDKRSIVKLALPPIDGGDWNKKIFYRMSDKRALNTAIHVLTDWSGSMSGDKMKYAADASGRLVHVFDRVLRVPVQLAAFTNKRTDCDIGLVKAFDKKLSAEQVAQAFARFRSYTSANNDADALMWAYNQLMKRPERRKILIVLSDGCPAGSWAGSGHKNLIHAAQGIEKEGNVELYGIGIKSDAVKSYYSNYTQLHSEKEINRALFEVIKNGC